MSDNRPIIFRTGIRLATFPALAAGLIVAAVFYIWQKLVFLSLFSGLLFALLVFVLVYMTSVYLLKKRLASMRSVIQKTPKHRQELSVEQSHGLRDEVDLIARESEETRKATHQEFRKMDETENYRKEFIGDISHELKTPIFSVQGYLETLQGGAMEDPEVKYRFLSKAMNNVNRLIELTKDLMEISKLETGEMEPEPELIPLNNIIQEVIESLQYKAAQNQVTIKFEQKESNIFAWTDRSQIRQLLINLIDNAIKYNKQGGSVYVSTSLSTERPGKIRIDVRDTGIGLEKEDLERVTERFYRVDKSRSREQGGTGLGLSIVKHILETHNEKLTIKSTPGKGSTFSFYIMNADRRPGDEDF